MKLNDITKLEQTLIAKLEAASTMQEVEDVRIDALGKNGDLTKALKSLSSLTDQERRQSGQALNRLRDVLNKQLAQKKEMFGDQELNLKLQKEKLDLSLPVYPRKPGLLHPIHQTINEAIAIFGSMGFFCQEGPDIEDDFHNFTALNFPAGHPARLMHDTFFMNSKNTQDDTLQETFVLRTHTSPVQIRTMLAQQPPIRVLAPGRAYRCDSDMTHTPMFHQIEGLVIDSVDASNGGVHFGHLKGCLSDFCSAFFGIEDVPLRFRPSYFPFTEPSVEIDIGCTRKAGQIQIGQGDDWLEILGGGMVHPNVLEHCGLDPQKYQGFAFGVGVERIAMLKYGMADLRQFFDCDVRWLKHYGFDHLTMASLLHSLS